MVHLSVGDSPIGTDQCRWPSENQIHQAVIDNSHEFEPVHHFTDRGIRIDYAIYRSAALAMLMAMLLNCWR